MSDIFDEINEDVRRDNLRKLWDKYSLFLVAGALIIVVGVGGHRAYTYMEQQKAAKAGAAFDRAVELVDEKKFGDAKTAFATIAAEAPAGYRVLAQLREAAAVATTDKPAAVKLYDAVAADGTVGTAQQELARIRAAALLIDTASYEDVASRVESAAAPAGIYRHSAREQLALAAWRTKNETAARKWIDLIIADVETPASLRGRAEALQALLPAAAKS